MCFRSSMGGIITAYMGSRYPHIFGHLGVFSCLVVQRA
ncbi:alpha/beta superfamily hydrolase [Mannheimia varigena USDA-ARS-USMARC-1312]|nr:alpha/beta superfamily hydrolase [Mannheimia varigena USDA-ARS-USMARC-1312]